MTQRLNDHFIHQDNKDLDDLNVLGRKSLPLFDLSKRTPSGKKLDQASVRDVFVNSAGMVVVRLVPKLVGGIKFQHEQHVGKVALFSIEDNIVSARIEMLNGAKIQPDESITLEYMGRQNSDGTWFIGDILHLRIEKTSNLK